MRVGKFLTVCSVSTLDTYLFFPDDGHCETIKSMSTCRESVGLRILTIDVGSSCKWSFSSQSCGFNPPLWTCGMILLHVLFTTLVAIAIYSIWSLLIGWLKDYENADWRIKAEKSKADLTTAHSDDYKLSSISSDPAQDELAASLKNVVRYYLAARLRKIQGLSDFILPSRECDSVLDNYSNKENNIFHLRCNRYGRLVIDFLDSSSMRGFLRRWQSKRIRRRLERMLDQSRIVADKLGEYLCELDSIYEMDSYLIRFFLVCLLKGHSKFIGAKYLNVLSSGKSPTKRLRFRGLAIVLVLLFVVLILLLAVMIVCQIFIGSRSIQLWLLITFIALMEDFCLLQPICILLNSCEIDSDSRNELLHVWKTARIRFKHILNRQQGFLLHANCLVQHFNPACRAARMKPDLPISRFLISVNDFDFPRIDSLKHRNVSRTAIGWSIRTLSNAWRTLFRSIFYLPNILRVFLFYGFFSVILNIIVIEIFQLATISLGGAIAVTIVIVLACLYVWPAGCNRNTKQSIQKACESFLSLIKTLLGHVSLEEIETNNLIIASRERKSTVAATDHSSPTLPVPKPPSVKETLSFSSLSVNQKDSLSLVVDELSVSRTRTLKEIDLTVMNESARLSLSLDSPFPYDRNQLTIDSSSLDLFYRTDGLNNASKDDFFRPSTSSFSRGLSLESQFEDFKQQDERKIEEGNDYVNIRNEEKLMFDSSSPPKSPPIKRQVTSIKVQPRISSLNNDDNTTSHELSGPSVLPPITKIQKFEVPSLGEIKEDLSAASFSSAPFLLTSMNAISVDRTRSISRNSRGSSRRGLGGQRFQSKPMSETDSISIIDFTVPSKSESVSVPKTFETYVRQSESLNESSYLTDFSAAAYGTAGRWVENRASTAELKANAQSHQSLFVESLDDGSVLPVDRTQSLISRQSSQSRQKNLPSVSASIINERNISNADESGLRAAALRAKRRFQQINQSDSTSNQIQFTSGIQSTGSRLNSSHSETRSPSLNLGNPFIDSNSLGSSDFGFISEQDRSRSGDRVVESGYRSARNSSRRNRERNVEGDGSKVEEVVGRQTSRRSRNIHDESGPGNQLLRTRK